MLPTLWCTLRRYERDVQRTIVQNFNLAMLAVTMITYPSRLGDIITPPVLPMLAVVLLAMLIPTLLGTRAYGGISEVAFRRLVLSLLTLSGLTLLSSGCPGSCKRRAAPFRTPLSGSNRFTVGERPAPDFTEIC